MQESGNKSRRLKSVANISVTWGVRGSARGLGWVWGGDSEVNRTTPESLEILGTHPPH